MKKAVLFILLMLIFVSPVSAKMYKLTYPDGSIYETEDYDEAQRLLNEWKLLKSGTSDENGEIILTDWLEEGEIKIVETLIPNGYEVDSLETFANLNNKEASIVHRKKSEESTNNDKEEKPSADPIPKKQERMKTPSTLDKIIIDSELLVISMLVMGIMIMLIKRTK